MKNMKKLVYENDYRVLAARQKLENYKQILQEILYEADILPLVSIHTMDELKLLIQNPKKFFLSMLPEPEQNQLFGIEIKKEKALELLDVDMSRIKNLIERANKLAIYDLLNDDFFSVIDLDEKGFLFVNDEKLEKLLDEYRTYAETEHELEIVDALETMTNALQTLIDLGVREQNFMGNTARKWTIKKQGRLQPNPKFFKEILK